jgi:hypothetical protein
VKGKFKFSIGASERLKQGLRLRDRVYLWYTVRCCLIAFLRLIVRNDVWLRDNLYARSSYLLDQMRVVEYARYMH